MIRLRPATLDDIPLLRHWDTQPHVRAAVANDGWRWETELAVNDWCESFIAELDGRPLGFVQVMDPASDPGRYWGEVPDNLRAIDIWIGEADDLGQGHGTKMMRLAIEHCFADPAVTGILIDPLASNTRAHRFYERLGFEFVERRMFDDDDCFVYHLPRRPGRGRTIGTCCL